MPKRPPAKLKILEAGKGGRITPKRLKDGRVTYAVKYFHVHIGTAQTVEEDEAMIAREAAKDPWRGKVG